VASEESFSRVLRGYDPAEVDPLVQKLRRELLSAKTAHDESLAQLKELETRFAELELAQDVKKTPTIAGLSTQLNNKLKKADKMAAEIVRRAESDALFIRSAAEKTSSQFIEAARDGYEAAHKEAVEFTNAAAKDARSQAELIISNAERAAAQLLADAQTEAQRLRGEAATVAANLRAESKNDVSRYMADAQREIEELKLVLTTNREAKISVSDSILKALKLNADGAAVRADMEAELQERHQESVMQTEKYIGAAEAQLATARTRLRAVEAEIETIQRSAQHDAEKLVEQARLKAEKEKTSADKLARKKIADAEKYVAAVLSSIYAQLEGIRVEREAVASFFEALRLELQQSLGDADSTKKLER
jgi:cell division septum initiation protein DivIVA